MKNILKLKTLLLVCLVGALGMLSSCDNDEETNSGQIALLSFGPSGVKHGETIKFIGENLDKVTAVVLPPGIEIAASSFVSQSDEIIEVTIPHETEAGVVVLKTPQGDIQTKSPLSFDVDVEVTSVTSEAKPGTNITITGDKLNWVGEIVFPANISVTEFVSQSMTEIVVTVPMEAQTGFLVFKSGGTDPLSFASEEQLVVTLPTVTALTPSSVKHDGNLTITGTNLDLITAVIFPTDKAVDAEDFVSQSETSIVVKVPRQTVAGSLTLVQHSPVDITTSQQVTIILPAASAFAPNPAIPGESEVTITGTNLDLVKKLTIAKEGGTMDIASTAFTEQTATQIKFMLPEGAVNGGVTYTTIHDFVGLLGVNVIIPGEGPPPLAITLYDDQVFFSGGDWSWGSTNETAVSEQFYSGTKSWKHTNTGSDGGASVGGMSAVNASGMGVFKFALYGGPGSDGKSVAAILNDTWGNYNTVTINEGEWTEYAIPVSNYPDVNFSAITRWIFKMEGASAGIGMYVDYVGFNPAGPPPLDYYIYDDGLQNGWQEWNGWGHDVKDFASTEEVFHGSKAIKMTFNDQWGAVQFGSPNTSVFSGYTTLSFRVYAPEAQDLIVQLNNDSDSYLSIPQGWSLVEIPIADLAGNGSVGELRIKNNNANLPVTLYFDEIGLNE